jgi:hypothetical protein
MMMQLRLPRCRLSPRSCHPPMTQLLQPRRRPLLRGNLLAGHTVGQCVAQGMQTRGAGVAPSSTIFKFMLRGSAKQGAGCRWQRSGEPKGENSMQAGVSGAPENAACEWQQRSHWIRHRRRFQRSNSRQSSQSLLFLPPDQCVKRCAVQIVSSGRQLLKSRWHPAWSMTYGRRVLCLRDGKHSPAISCLSRNAMADTRCV